MKITVYNRVPLSADVTVEQVTAYLRRTGRGRQLLPLVPAGSELQHAIYFMAYSEGRQPGEVLADMARIGMLDQASGDQLTQTVDVLVRAGLIAESKVEGASPGIGFYGAAEQEKE
jgi:hypothetical protein